MPNPWDDICEWMRSHSANLANVLNNLSNQGTYSDIGTGSDSITAHQNQSGFPVLQVFMIVLLLVWGALYVQGRNNRNKNAKPKPLDSSTPRDPPPSAGLS